MATLILARTDGQGRSQSRFVIQTVRVVGEQVQHVIDRFPDQCQRCQQPLPTDPTERVIQGQPRRHQLTELPPLQPDITEYRMHDVVCGNCREVTPATLPAEVQGQFEPQLTALVAYMTVVGRVPRRLVRDFLESVLRIALSLGSTQKAWEETSAAVASRSKLEEQGILKQAASRERGRFLAHQCE